MTSNARHEAALEQQEHHDSMVLDAIRRVNGIQMRVMEFRKHIREPLREAQIKDSLKRLIEKGYIVMVNEKRDSRGNIYRIA